MAKEKSEYLYIPFADIVQDNHKRRNSTGKIGYLDGGVNVVSRYLRPSMGSCHDFCKYGEERALEIKARGPMPMSKRIMASEGKEVGKTVTSTEKVKKSAANVKPPLGPHTREHDDRVVKEEVSSSIKKETTSSKQVSSPLNKKDLSLERASDPVKREVSSLAKEETDVLVKQASAPIKREVSSLVKEETISSNQVSTPIKEIDVVMMERAGDPINNETISSSRVLTSNKEEDVFMEHASDPFNKEASSLTNEEAISSSQCLTSIKEVGVYVKHANEPINSEVSSLANEIAISSRQDLPPLKEVDVFMNHASDPINKEISSLEYKEAISSNQVLTATMAKDVIMNHASDSFNKEAILSSGLTPLEEIDVHIKHATDPINREVPSLAKKDATLSRQISTPLKEVDVLMKDASDPLSEEVSSVGYKEAILSSGLTPLEEIDVHIKHATDPINREVPSLAKKDATLSRQISTPLKEVDVLMKDASDPLSEEVSSVGYKEAISSSQNSTSIKEVGIYMKHANEPINRDVSSLAKKEAIPPRQVSRALKKVGVNTKNPSDPKLKKPMKSNLSSVARQRGSNTQADGKIRKSKLSINSPGVSTVRRKSEIKTSKEMSSSIKAERRVLVPPAVSLSTKLAVKRSSSRNVEKSNNPIGVSHLGVQRTVRKPKYDQSSSRDGPEKTLPALELISKRKTLRPVKKGIGATDLSSSLDNRSLKRVNHGIRTAELTPLSVRRNLRPTQAEVHTAQSPQSTSSPKSKVLRSNRLVGTHVTSSTLSSPESPSAKGSMASEHSTMETEKGVLHLKKDNNTTPRKGVTMRLKTMSVKDKSDPGIKLTFRRGKVIEIKQEDNTPRRLKFKQRLPGGNQNIEGDASRVFSLAKREGDASRVLTVAKKEVDGKEVSVTKTESKKIVLQRRDVKGGRNSGSLCNNVIEETVSKLAKTRASKVKALVGAFESLISLQDTNVTGDAS